MVLEESPSEGLRLGCYRRPTSAQELIGIVRWALIGQPGLPASNHHKGPNQFYLTFPWPPLAVAAGDKSVVVRWFLELFWLLFWQKSVGLFLDQMDFKTLLWWLFGPQRNCLKVSESIRALAKITRRYQSLILIPSPNWFFGDNLTSSIWPR